MDRRSGRGRVKHRVFSHLIHRKAPRPRIKVDHHDGAMPSIARHHLRRWSGIGRIDVRVPVNLAGVVKRNAYAADRVPINLVFGDVRRVEPFIADGKHRTTKNLRILRPICWHKEIELHRNHAIRERRAKTLLDNAVLGRSRTRVTKSSHFVAAVGVNTGVADVRRLLTLYPAVLHALHIGIQRIGIVCVGKIASHIVNRLPFNRPNCRFARARREVILVDDLAVCRWRNQRNRYRAYQQ